MTKLIQPKILQGTRDFLPKDMAKRQFVMNAIRDVFVRFGYDTIETPVIEYSETLLGKYGDEGNKLIYRFEDNGGRDIALRYDQTIPFARLVAANWRELPMPFKRYQISRVWRADKPAKGRYREFYQCDIDVIGTESLVAEAEVAKVVFAVFKQLGFKDFSIKVNSRRLINQILESLKIQDKQTSVIRILDKLEKIGVKEVTKELSEIIDFEKTSSLMQIVTFKGSNSEKIRFLKNFDTSEIDEFLKLSKSFGVKEKNLDFDISLARGLDYYTGIIYEVYVNDVNVGALCAGGRYDDLCGLFCKEKFSGVGVAFGFDRIVLAMEELGLLKDIVLSSDVLVTYFDDETLSESLKILSDIQDAGVNAEVYFQKDKLSKQFKYADKKEISFVVVLGPEELKKGDVTVKVMATGKQVVIPRSQLTSYLTGFSL